MQAQQDYRLPKYLKSWQTIDLVIIDELGYIGLGPGGPLLLQFCVDRYERGSLLITSNLEFSRWGEVFGDATLTSALLDRLTHHSTILLFEGESYRFRESQCRRMRACFYFARVVNFSISNPVNFSVEKHNSGFVWFQQATGDLGDWLNIREENLRGLRICEVRVVTYGVVPALGFCDLGDRVGARRLRLVAG